MCDIHMYICTIYKVFITIFVRFGSYDRGSIYSVNMECMYLEESMQYQAVCSII